MTKLSQWGWATLLLGISLLTVPLSVSADNLTLQNLTTSKDSAIRTSSLIAANEAPLYSDIYEGLTKNVVAGYYFGLSEVDGVPCHHLVFVQDNVDWQIWIEDSDTPLPRKVAVGYKDKPGVPRYLAVINDWNLTPQVSKDEFTFTPPVDAKEVELVQVTPY